jgi:predicted nucleic acid-binding protein
MRATALLNQLVEIPLTQSIVERTIELRSMVSIKLPDAVIAASALVENLPLMTRNTGDFMRIPGLMLVDPFAA